MKILAVDTSSLSGSIALLDEGRLIAEATTCIQKNHAERLLPSIKNLMDSIGMGIKEVDGFALATGPGSFTGLRIGLSTIKGLAWSLNRPVAGVSTLQALAMNISYADKPVCPLLDARKKEVYAGVYRFQDEGFKMQGGNKKDETCGLQPAICLMADTAISPHDLVEHIAEPTIFLGDGLRPYENFLRAALKERAIIAPMHLWLVKASNIGLLAWMRFKSGKAESPDTIRPNYLRQPEAELKTGSG